MALGGWEEQLNKKAAEIANGDDEATGKPISVSKAEILIKATDVHDKVNRLKHDLQNIEQFLGATKYLQKSLIKDWNNLGLT